METRNITLNLPTDLLRQVKIYAAEHDTTVNAYVRELLQQTLSRQTRTREAVDQLLALGAQGLRFSADLQSIDRTETHERA